MQFELAAEYERIMQKLLILSYCNWPAAADD